MTIKYTKRVERNTRDKDIINREINYKAIRNISCIVKHCILFGRTLVAK